MASGATARPDGVRRWQALGRLPKGVMNKTEAAYAAHLRYLENIGEILWFKFEGIKLKLASSTFITVDFFVMLKDGSLEAHEVKGFMLDDANAKLKIAASMYPFTFKLIRKSRGGAWDIKVI